MGGNQNRHVIAALLDGKIKNQLCLNGELKGHYCKGKVHFSIPHSSLFHRNFYWR